MLMSEKSTLLKHVTSLDVAGNTLSMVLQIYFYIECDSALHASMPTRPPEVA